MTKDDLDQASGFSAKLIEGIIFQAVTDIAAEVSRKRMVVSRGEVEDLVKARQDAVATLNAHFDNMQAMVDIRRANLIKYGHIRFVSLGFDCLPRTLLTRWGFKRSAKLGEKSMPFDLAVHAAHGVEAIIAGDFDFYQNGPLTFDAKARHAVYPLYGVSLNHEIGDQFYADEWNELRARYKARADNFRAMLADDAPVMFVHHADGEAEYIVRAFDLVRRLRGHRPTACVCIHNPPFRETSPLPLAGSDIHMIERQYPFKGYAWHIPRHTFSQRGFKFERDMAERLAEIIALIGWDGAGHIMPPASRASSPCSQKLRFLPNRMLTRLF